MYTVYKHLDEDENILYIGKSKSLLYRQRQHRNNAEWFDEVDSIEYCTFSSKSEMDLVEVYLINTLSPKYNKKDKRDDVFTSLKLDELNWLQFDMCEIEVVEKVSKIEKLNDYENFILDNIDDCVAFSIIGNTNSELFKIGKLNKKLKLIKEKVNGEVFKFKDVLIYRKAKFNEYKFDGDCSSIPMVCLCDDNNFDFIFKNITKSNSMRSFTDGFERVVIHGIITVKSEEEKFYANVEWDD